MHLFSVAKATGHPASARDFGQSLLTAYTRANSERSEDRPLGAELAHKSGHVYRIDSSKFPPNVCPCCSGLVRPGDHASAGDEDAYCLGCFTWQRDVPACLPANSAHPEGYVS